MGPIPLIAFMLAAATPEPQLEASRGAPVTLDGIIGEAEWRDAASLPIAGGYRLYAKLAGDDLLLALRNPAPAFVGVDLYVDRADGSLFNLHASAQLGERIPQGQGWTPWRWGNNVGWESHVTRRTADPGAFLPDQGREFRIPARMLAAPEFRLRIGLNDDNLLVWPADTAQRDSQGWARVRLPPQ